jgi:hypothetical protein
MRPPENGGTAETDRTAVLTITAMGSCLPAGDEMSVAGAAARFDVLSCGWTSDGTSPSAGLSSGLR